MSEDNRTFADEVRDEVAEAIAKMPLEHTLEALVKTHGFTFADAARIVAAAQAAEAHRMILSLPEGYDTPVSAGGGVHSRAAKSVTRPRHEVVMRRSSHLAR